MRASEVGDSRAFDSEIAETNATNVDGAKKRRDSENTQKQSRTQPLSRTPTSQIREANRHFLPSQLRRASSKRLDGEATPRTTNLRPSPLCSQSSAKRRQLSEMRKRLLQERERAENHGTVLSAPRELPARQNLV